MKNQISTDVEIERAWSQGDLLNRLQMVSTWVQNELEHEFWCSNEFPMGHQFDSFEILMKPVESYMLSCHGERVAYIELHHNSEGWVLARNVVRPDQRGKGYSVSLMQYALEQAFHKADTAFIFRVENNTIAENLHRKFGFQVVQRHSGIKLVKCALSKQNHSLNNYT